MRATIRVLNGMVRDGILEHYAVGGAVGALFWMEPIDTYDLDVFILVPPQEGRILSLERLYAHLEKKGYRPKGEQVVVEGVPVQFLIPDALGEEAVREAVERCYEDEPVRVIGPEHLLAIMARTGRDKDHLRIRMMLDQASIDRNRLEEILRRHALEGAWSRLSGGRDG